MYLGIFNVLWIKKPFYNTQTKNGYHTQRQKTKEENLSTNICTWKV